MRIVHFAQFGPRACGLYETAKDLILAERRLGVDARLVDCDEREASRVGLADGQIITDDPAIAMDADVLVRHSAIPSLYHNLGKPIVMCIHGRPESSYRMSAATDNDVTQAIANKATDCRYKAFVTFWPEFEPAWGSLVDGKFHCVPAPVDLDYYRGGADKHFAGSRRILIADIWRDDVTPLDCLFAAARYIERYDRQAKVHLVGIPSEGKELAALRPFLNGLAWCIGSAAGHMKDIRDWYASCDCLVTPHTIATRIIRESLSAGLPVVAAAGCRWTPYVGDPRSPDSMAEAIRRCLSDPDARDIARRTAEIEFDSTASARVMIEVCRQVLNHRDGGRKVFLDVGAHVGETVRRFFRERPDAGEYEIYAFEPDPEIFKKLFAVVGSIPNVHCVCAALASAAGTRMLHRGKANDGEGSTLITGKQTGGLSGEVPVACVNASSWINDRLGPADHVIVKMNIEGAEYEILPDLVATGAMGRIDELYVQLHSLKFPTEQRIEMDRTELQWRDSMSRFATKVHITTKGMASFGHS
jgi:FkbM family methyltransferase